MTAALLPPRNYRALKPPAQAFLLAYLSSTGPKALSILISLLRKNRSSDAGPPSLERLLAQALRPNRFPTFCAVLVGGATLLQEPLYQFLTAIAQRSTASANRPNKRDLRLLARFLAACIGSAASFHLINRTDPPETNGLAQAQGELPAKQDEVQSAKPPSQERNRRSKIPPGLSDLRRPDLFIAQPRLTTSGVPLAGKTIDLTIFAAVRALDTLLQLVPQSSNPRIRRVWQAACKAFGPFIFITSSATIMHAFFYAPSRLPRTYVSWIQRLARLDERLLHALRQIRYGNFVYGQDTGMAPLLKGMCEDYGVPVEWGDPAKSIPIPCELVHHGSGPSCEVHALRRLFRGITMAMGVYAPIQAIMLLRRFYAKRSNHGKAMLAALIDALRSSTFLGAFIALFYYGVCLSRTRLGPKIVSYKTITPQMWDGGLCILGGCAACGWSIFCEVPRRQTELALFVVPRAIAAWFPRRYDRADRWKEQVIFTLSAATVLTAAQQWPNKVRGVFGGVLRGVLTA